MVLTVGVLDREGGVCIRTTVPFIRVNQDQPPFIDAKDDKSMAQVHERLKFALFIPA